MCAAQSLGGVPVPVYQDSVADELAYVVEHAGARFALAENQEQVDKLLEIQKKVPTLEVVMYQDPRGLRHYEGLLSVAEVQQRGAKRLEATPDLVSSEVAQGRGADDAIMLYTSGTTGRPKGAVLSYDNLIWAAKAGADFDGLTEGDELLSYLPMAWVGDHIFSYAQCYVVGLVVNCPESAATVMTDLREIGPTYFFAPPRMLENLITQVTIRMEDAGFIKRRLFHYFMALARRVGPALLDGRPVSLIDRLLYGAGQPAGLRAAQEHARHDPRARRLHRGRGDRAGDLQLLSLARRQHEAALRPDRGLGVRHHPAQRRGQPRHGRQAGARGRARIAESGEVLFRSPGVFKEYYKNPQATTDTKTAGRLGPYRRRRLLRRARASAHHRPRQGRREAERRHAVRAQIHREQAEVLPAHQGGGGVRRRPRLRRGLRQHRPDRGRQLGRAAQPRLCQLPGAGGAHGGLRPDRRARSSRSTATSPPIRAWPARRSAAS